MPALFPIIAITAIFVYVTAHGVLSSPPPRRRRKANYQLQGSNSAEGKKLTQKDSSFALAGQEARVPSKSLSPDSSSLEVATASLERQLKERESTDVKSEHATLSQISSAINAKFAHIQEHQVATEQLKEENRNVLSELEKVVSAL
ncbi:MAG: hypothetical protein ABG776_12540 [Cyanobacteria bacterium J06555_13]